MFKRRKFGASFAIFGFYAASFVVLLLSYGATPDAPNPPKHTLWTLSTMTATIDGVSQEVTLPYTFEGLADRTTVTLSASFIPPAGDSVYIQSEYTPIRIYWDNTLLYEYGQDGTFPAAMMDPAMAGQMLTLHGSDASVEFVAEYQSPITQGSFTVEPFYFGTQSTLYVMIFNTAGFPFIFSIMLLFLGLFLCIITLLITSFERKAFPIFLLGLSVLFAGFWLFCDSNIAITFFSMPIQLYLVSIFAMAILPVGLALFALSMLNLQHKIVLQALAALEFAFSFAAVLMLLTGIVHSMIRVDQAFHVLVPLCFFVFSLDILFEYFIYRDETLRRFVLPITIFALFTILDFFNSRYHFAYLPVSFLEMGIILFLLAVGILAGFFMRDALRLQTQNQQAAFEMKLMGYQAELLKKHSRMMMDNADNLKKQRHDLRHQLTVLQDLAQQENPTALNEYLGAVLQQIPAAPTFYCSNATVNAILSHYATLCEKDGIELTIDLNLPDQTEAFPDTDYCVIFGNLLENAVEACGYLPQGQRFIHLHSHRRYHTLLITMENSFDGQFKRRGGVFHSRKRQANGIGLTSVQSVAEKHGGGAQFNPGADVFTCSVYMVVTSHTQANNEGATC